MTDPTDAELAALLRAAKTAHEAFLAAQSRYHQLTHETWDRSEDDRYNAALDARGVAVKALQEYVLGTVRVPKPWAESMMDPWVKDRVLVANLPSRR